MHVEKNTEVSSPNSFLGNEFGIEAPTEVLVDLSSCGILKVSGKDAIDLLQRISTNDFTDFCSGAVQTTVLLTEKGRIIDVIRVLHFDDSLLLITSHGSASKVMTWIERFVIMEDVQVEDISGQLGMFLFLHLRNDISLSGPDLEQFKFASRTDYHGYPATLCLTMPAALPNTISKPLFFSSTEAQDFQFMRLLLGLPMYPHEINEMFNPLEVNLKRYVSFSKGCYIGQEVIARLITYAKVSRLLCNVSTTYLPDSGKKDSVLSGGREVGTITSISRFPGHNETCIGLAVLKKDFARSGEGLITSAGAQVSVLKCLTDT